MYTGHIRPCHLRIMPAHDHLIFPVYNDLMPDHGEEHLRPKSTKAVPIGHLAPEDLDGVREETLPALPLVLLWQNRLTFRSVVWLMAIIGADDR